METVLILDFIKVFLAPALLAWFWYDKKRSDKRIDDLSGRIEDVIEKVTNLKQKQIEHEMKFTTEEHVRNIFKEEIASVKEDIREIKSSQKDVQNDVSGLLNQITDLVVQIKIENAIREAVEEEKKR